MKEKLRLSLDEALAFQKLNDTYRNVLRQVLEQHPEISDELTLVIIAAYNGIGNVQVSLFKVIETIQGRLEIFGNGEGVEKKLLGRFVEEDNDLNDYQMEEEQDEYIDDCDDDEYRDEWELDSDD